MSSDEADGKVYYYRDSTDCSRGAEIGGLDSGLRFRAVIEDSVHGAIKITSEEYVLLQTPFMRRLHEIKQLGLAYLVFPTATHSRLEHSLGVTHLMYRVASRIASRAIEDERVCEAIALECSPRALRAFVEIARLSAFIHDSGHLAFSHTSEEALSHLVEKCAGGGSGPACRVARRVAGEAEALGGDLKIHEVYTVYFIEKLAGHVEGESEELSLKLEAALDVVKKKGEKPGRAWRDLGLGENAFALISKLLSNEIYDVDRVDYLVRDARYTGVVYGYIDLDRLIEGVDVVSKDGSIDLIVSPKAVPSIEDVFDARFKMYRTVYFHHKLQSIQLAVSRVLELILEEWSELDPQLYSEVGDPADLFSPSRLAELIASEYLYLDDNEALSLIKLSARRGSRLLKRWAKALLHDRQLLPVSLVKRTEEVVGDRVLPAASFRELVSVLAGTDFDKVAENSIRGDLRSLGVDGSEVKVCGSVRRIVDPGFAESLELTQYLRSVSEAATLPIVQVYVYSDDENIHRLLYRERWLLRKKYRDALLEEVVRSLRG